jgi:small-conductance mechanosensitive channel
METPSKVNLQILKEFNAAGLNFAFPTQTLYIDQQHNLDSKESLLANP